MKSLITFLLLFLSFNAFSGISVTYCAPSTSCPKYNINTGYCGDTIDECKASFDGTFTTKNGTFYVTTLYRSGSDRWYGKATRGDGTTTGEEFYVYINDTGSGCHSAEECYQQALRECTNISQELKDFTFHGNDSDPKFTKQCSTQKTDNEKCQDSIVAQCANNFGASEINYTDNGDGSSSCTGTCTDGTNAEDIVSCEPTRQNNYCDTPDAPSELDFSNGYSGSEIDENPLSDKTPENVYDNDYTPDGSNPDTPANIVLDSLINSVNKLNNDTTDIIDKTASANRKTIIEKSDHIIQANEQGINALIDETRANAFNDVNIVSSLNQIQDDINNNTDDLIQAINGLNSNSDDLDSNPCKNLFDCDDDIINSINNIGGNKIIDNDNSAGFAAWDNLTNSDKIAEINDKITELKSTLTSKLNTFSSDLLNNISLTPPMGNYTPINIDLGQWGNHDISLSRFQDYFAGVGNVLYLLATIYAFFIVLGSKR